MPRDSNYRRKTKKESKRKTYEKYGKASAKGIRAKQASQFLTPETPKVKTTLGSTRS